jgi:hypothetical protein
MSDTGGLGRAAQQNDADRFAENIIPIIRSIQAAGPIGMVSIAKVLNDRGVRTARGARWHPSSVRNVIERIAD